MMILWFVIIGVLIYFLLGGNLNVSSFQRKSADNHLDERLAKGEISIKEYQDLRTTMKENK